jgi:heptose III glucuronosyltransferase
MPPAQPIVSVIVPAYNAAEFLPRCLDALLCPDGLQKEIIVVDDGSTDATAEVVIRYQARHVNVRLVRQINAGVSVARNAGLAIARGEYVAFADADDHVFPGMLALLVAHARGQNLQMVIGNATLTSTTGGKRSLFPPDVTQQVMRGDDWLVCAVTNRYMRHYIWTHLYCTDFLRRYHLQFVPGISHQDIVWTNQALLLALRVGYLPEFVYCYYQRPGSLSKPLTSRGLLREAQHYVRVAECIERLAKSLPHQSATRAVIASQVLDEGIAALHLARKLAGPHRQQLFSALREKQFIRLLLRNASSGVERRRVWRRAMRFQFWQWRGWISAFVRGNAEDSMAALDGAE